MKRLFYTLCFFAMTMSAHAQVSYGDLFLVDYNMKINVSVEKDSVFLSLTFTSASRKMSDKPKLLIRLMDDIILSLDGQLLDSTSKSDGAVMIGNVAYASHHFITEAKFPIQREQIEQFNKGIKKLRLNTSPKYHEKEWKRDKIGKKLFNKYKESSSNSFEDKF